jgi:hypothetical protein
MGASSKETPLNDESGCRPAARAAKEHLPRPTRQVPNGQRTLSPHGGCGKYSIAICALPVAGHAETTMKNQNGVVIKLHTTTAWTFAFRSMASRSSWRNRAIASCGEVRSPQRGPEAILQPASYRANRDGVERTALQR